MHFLFFLLFFRENKIDIPGELSARQAIHMKKKIKILSSADEKAFVHHLNGNNLDFC